MKCLAKCPCPKPTVRHVLNVRTEILRFNGTINSATEQLRDDMANYTTLAFRMAEWNDRAGSERFASDIHQAGQSWRVWMFYDPGVTGTLTPADRLREGGASFNIDALARFKRNGNYMILDVTETK